jgi:3-oxoacyl-[acyl-carrier protein] reductase
VDLGLAGRKAIISGGSRGIGKAIAARLLDEGARVALGARGKEDLDAAVAELSDKGVVHGTAVDLSDGPAVAAWVAEAASALGGLDIVVANASAGGGGGSSEEAWQAHLQVDVLGLVRMVEAALPYLKASDTASIVSMATTAALEQFASGTSAYNALNAAVITYTSGLSQSLAKDGIRANCVSPGPVFIERGLWDGIRQRAAPFYEATLAAAPMGRFGTAEEVANVVAFLVSPAASWVTGENVVVDGGFTRRVAF